jgi:anaerobic magnesium-protoporphyrin IX monomethyl ester cyclase
MKVCLATRHLNSLFTPLALLYLKAYLVAHGDVEADEVTIAEFPEETNGDHIAQVLLAEDPTVVGFSCYVWNIKVQLDAAKCIKAARPGVRIVLGGPEVGPMAEAVLAAHPYVDVVVRSEGEVPFCELVKCWRDGGSVADVLGVCHRDGGRVVVNDDAEIVADLSQLASPHFSNYIDHTNRIVSIETQRGCVFRCNFCFYNKDLSIRNRRFELSRVKEEILYWLNQDVREIYLMDPVFNLNAPRAKEICRFIAEHNHRSVPFHTEVWAEFIDKEMAELFVAANFKFIEVGLQTTDTSVLQTVERRLKLKPFLDGISHLKKSKLEFELQLIAGLPGETLESFRKSLSFAASLDPPQLAVYVLMILPGTELWRKANALAIVYEREPPYEVVATGSMSALDIDEARAQSRTGSALWVSRTLRLLSRSAGQSYADIVDAWIARHRGLPPESSRPAFGKLPDLLPGFVDYYCETRGVPSEFFRTFAAIETKHLRAAVSGSAVRDLAGSLHQ